MLEFALISKSRTKKVPNSCVGIEIVLPRHWMCCGLFTYSHNIVWYRTLRYESTGSTGTRSVFLYQRRPGSKNFKFFCFVRHMEYIYRYIVHISMVPYVYEMVGWRSTCRWYSNPCLILFTSHASTASISK